MRSPLCPASLVSVFKPKKLLKIVLDNILTFNEHIENIYQIASRKLIVLAKQKNYVELPRRRILINVFLKLIPTIVRSSKYIKLVLLITKWNGLHEQCLRIICNDNPSVCEELLFRDDSISIYHKNIHTFAIEMYKAANTRP